MIDKTRMKNFRVNERGFTLPELMIVIAIMGILLGIASASWQRVMDGNRVVSATNQMKADLRLANTSATNRLTTYQVRLEDSSSTYQFGPADSTTLRKLPDGATVDLPSANPLTLTFKSDGSVEPTPSVDPIKFKVQASSGSESHDIEVNPVTSRVAIDG